MWFARRLAGEARGPFALSRRLGRGVATVLRLAGLTLVWRARRLVSGRRDTVHLFYDLQVSPVTFDFCWALLAGEIRRRTTGAYSLTVVIVPGDGPLGLRRETPDYEAVINPVARRARLDNIIVSLCRLLPSVADVVVCHDRAQAGRIRIREVSQVVPQGYWPSFPGGHLPRHIFEFGAAGISVPLPLRAPSDAVDTVDAWLAEHGRGRDIVVITLRDYGYMTPRNSDLEAWLDFAQGLDSGRFLVVIVPDPDSRITDGSDRFRGIVSMDAAATDVALRLALYERAYLNLMVNTGPYILCMMSARCRLLMFKITTAGVPQAERDYLRYLGFEIGKTPRIAGPFQKWVWHDDDRETIETEFAAMSRLIDKTPVGK